MLKTRYSYDRFAWCYESIARVVSLGAIPRVKASQIAALAPAERVLYGGVGAGEDTLLAARGQHRKTTTAAHLRSVCLDCN